MVTGIIAEYNPFHLGHALHLNAAREAGADRVAVVMSGSFTQRAETAICSKRSRALAALKCGADLVLELPAAYATGGARSFALGGVRLLAALGCVDTLCFGSETGDTQALCRLADFLESAEFSAALRSYLERGMSFASARSRAVRECMGGAADILDGANDALGLEYIKALREESAHTAPLAVKRRGAAHGGEVRDGVASASFIRERVRANVGSILGGDSSGFAPYMPRESAEILLGEIAASRAPSDMGRLGAAILCALRRMSAQEIALTADISEGIENRVVSAARRAGTLEELYSSAKTKRYTHARIRRIVLHAFLGIRAQDVQAAPEYIRVLGFNAAGRELISAASASARLPIVTGAAQIRSLGAAARRRFETECAASDIFALSLPAPLPCGEEERYGVISL